MSAISNKKQKKILIIALSGIGDALMLTPALQLLKKELPAYSIDALVMYKGVEQLYKTLPQINKIHYFDFLNSTFFHSLKFIFSIRKKYDYTVNVYPSNRKEYNIISFIIGAENRVAVNYLRHGKRNFSFLNNQIILENDNLHNVEENVRLIELITNKKENKIPPLLFPVTDKDMVFADKFLSENRILKNEIVIGFHPGCSTLKNHIERRWSPEKFAELADKLSNELGAIILLFGGPEEKDLRNSIVHNSQAKNIITVNSNNVTESAAVMKRCNVFVSNDSGLMHIAASQKLKIVSIIGPTNITYIHPWQTEFKIASLNLECSPCFYYSPTPLKCSRTDKSFKCIKELSVQYIFNSVNDFLSTNTQL